MTIVRVKCPNHGVVDQYHTQVVVDLSENRAVVFCPLRHSFVAPLNDEVADLLLNGGCKTVDESVSDFANELEKL